MRRILFSVACLAALGCRGQPRQTSSSSDLASMVSSLVPVVEQATHLKFQRPPKFALRSKERVREYLLGELNQQFPPSRVEGIKAAYSLLDLVPDTLDIKALLLPLYSEQVVGYYDADSLTLYAVEGSEGDQLRLVLAHELVHALQHEHLPLQRLLKDSVNSDRVAAQQAVLEGHATIAMFSVILPNANALQDPDFWRQYREQIKDARSSQPVFSRAPVVLQESLVFPYLAGAEFMRWWETEGKPPLPTLEDMPHSTEQVLHPDRYLRKDEPVAVTFADAPDSSVIHEDTMGELELQIWSGSVRGGGEVESDLAIGWGGDRYRVYRTPAGPALVLYTVWDDSVSARGFASGPAARFSSRARVGYRTSAEAFNLDGRFAVRVVRAPVSWDRWTNLPKAAIGRAEHASQ